MDGFKHVDLGDSHLNSKFIERVHRFCRENIHELREEQLKIECTGRIRYPRIKLVDMYFWHIAFELGARSNEVSARQRRPRSKGRPCLTQGRRTDDPRFRSITGTVLKSS